MLYFDKTTDVQDNAHINPLLLSAAKEKKERQREEKKIKN